MTFRSALVLVLVFGLHWGSPVAQQDKEPSAKNFFSRLAQQQKSIWQAPFKADNWRSGLPLLMIGLSAASFSLDGDASRCLRESGDFGDFNSLFASTPADIVLTTFPLPVLAAGELTDHRPLAHYGWKATEASLNAYLVVTVLKAATQRSRPHSGDVYGFWEGGNSFPSGHAATAWAVAAVTSRHFSQKKWVPWIVYPVAGLISFSRVTSGNHFVSDAVTGSLIGFAIGRFGVN